MLKKLVVICLINFLIAALMGLALRFSFLESIGLNYRFLTHAHSHVAMLGWVYLMLYALFVHYFIPNKTKVFTRLFWVTEFAVVGMMLSFPFVGYAAISITFSTLHILCSYYFVYLMFKHQNLNTVVSKRLLNTALIFMLISTGGVWCLGPAVAIQGPASAWYQIAIQFFLHFQFNGWFLIAVIALFFHLLKIEDSRPFRLFFMLLLVVTVLTFALPIQWFLPHQYLLFINGVAVLLQFILGYLFFQLVRPKLNIVLAEGQRYVRGMLVFALLCFVLKIVFQGISILPAFASVVYTHRNFVIGFIHLLMLGVVSGFLFAYIFKAGLVTNSKSLTIGVYSFVLGFVLTELLLLVQGGLFYFGIGILPNYYLLLFLFSLFLPLGISFILFDIVNNKAVSA